MPAKCLLSLYEIRLAGRAEKLADALQLVLDQRKHVCRGVTVCFVVMLSCCRMLHTRTVTDTWVRFDLLADIAWHGCV